MEIIKAENISAYYGKKCALNNITFSVDEGTVLGIIGPNGSGKTTLLKVISNFIKTYTVTITLNGEVPGIKTKGFVAFQPDVNIFRKNMKIKDAISFFSLFFADFKMEKAKEMLDFMKLSNDMYVRALSKGMTEKLNLALTLSRDSLIYVIDEPLAGVDPIARDQILDSLIEYCGENKTLIITTQLVRDMENVFDKAMFLNEGEIILFDDCEKIREKYRDSIDGTFKKIYTEGVI